MFASRLLNVLQTVPNDVEYETAFDVAGQDTTMKENQKATTALDSKDSRPQAFEVKGDASWIPKFADNLSIDCENRATDSSGKEDQNGLSYHLNPCHESSVQEITLSNGNETRDSSSSSDIAASDLLATDESLHTNNGAMEYELPELMVCYKEVNYHIVKDTRVDEGMPVVDQIVIESCQEHANQHGSKEENNSNFEKSMDKDNTEHCDPDDSVQTADTNFGSTGKSTTGSPDDGSLVDKKLPIQEFGTRSFLRSSIISLDDEGKKVVQVSDQTSPGKAVSEAPTAQSIEPGPKEDVQARSLLCNSEVESRSITFNFNSPGNVKEQPVDSADVHAIHNGNARNDNEEPLSIDNENSNDSSASSQVQSCSSKDNVQEQPKRSSASNDEQAISEANLSKLYDEGETSFSATGRVNYSEPIAFSGSLSDGSTTSARSFAFPVLQNEWNSSPVRMAKADRRHFRRHKGWRSGLFCCRF